MNVSETRILIADNDPRMATSLKLLLNSAADRILIACSAQETEGLLENFSPDLVLADAALVGPQIGSWIHRLHLNDPALPVLLMTAGRERKSAAQAYAQGAYEFLNKPFEPVELIRKIGRALEERRLAFRSGVIRAKGRMSPQRYKFLVENSPDIIYALDHRGRFTFANQTLDRILGYSPESLMGQPYRSIVDPRDQGKARWVFNERRTGSRSAQRAQLRLAARPMPRVPDPEERPAVTVEVTAVGVYDKPAEQADKQFLGTYGVARDVTCRKIVETQLNHVRKMEAIGSLVGGIAHHFNNLLMGIQGCTSLLLSHCRMCSRRELSKLKRIEKLVEDGAELNAQLVEYARGGRHQIRTLNLNELITRAAEEFVPDPETVHIKLDLLPRANIIRADAQQIRRVFLHLLRNAVQAMPGGGTIRISARPWRLPQGRRSTPEYTVREYVRIQVADSGIGMSPATLRRVFDPFFSARFQGRGTGLGLAAAQGIIINHGGVIEAASTPGKGTVFTILLPVARTYDASASTP